MFGVKRGFLLIGGGLLLFTSLLTATAELYDHSEPFTVPDESWISVTLDQGLSSNQSRLGGHFGATVSQAVLIGDKTVIPAGTLVEGLVVDSQPSSHWMGRARLQLALESIDLDGKSYDLRTDPSVGDGGNHKKRNWAWIGGGAGVLMGALAGGGKGALVGNPAGAGGAAVVAYPTGQKEIYLGPETSLTFRLAEPLTIGGKS
jgi:hypothetical protein